VTPHTVYASPCFLFLVGSVGTAGKLGFVPLTAAFGVYGFSSFPHAATDRTAAVVINAVATDRRFIGAPKRADQEGRPDRAITAALSA
jgi:hypothetical protein